VINRKNIGEISATGGIKFPPVAPLTNSFDICSTSIVTITILINMQNTFANTLTAHRNRLNLTVQTLADKAKVNPTLVSGLQNNKRQVGENNARRLGIALNLSGKELENFVYAAINECSEKVMEQNKPYPAEVLNLCAKQLQESGIDGDQISRCVLKPKLQDGREPDAIVYMNDGRAALIELKITPR